MTELILIDVETVSIIKCINIQKTVSINATIMPLLVLMTINISNKTTNVLQKWNL